MLNSFHSYLSKSRISKLLTQIVDNRQSCVKQQRHGFEMKLLPTWIPYRLSLSLLNE